MSFSPGFIYLNSFSRKVNIPVENILLYLMHIFYSNSLKRVPKSNKRLDLSIPYILFKVHFLQTYTIITYAMTGATIYMIKNKLHDAVSALLTDLPLICTSKYGFSQASIRFPFEHEIFT